MAGGLRIDEDADGWRIAEARKRRRGSELRSLPRWSFKVEF
jgi:hypothetical protein